MLVVCLYPRVKVNCDGSIEFLRSGVVVMDKSEYLRLLSEASINDQ